MFEAYTYTGLQAREIRIATLDPGDFDDEISIRFSHAPLNPDTPPLYEALSYTWGVATSSTPVKVSGNPNGQISVTKNLEIALRHLRDASQPRQLWIDALCINQADNAEKGAQVAMMGDVYRQAVRVVIWLGPEQDESDRALGLMAEMGSNVQVNPKLRDMTPADNAEDLTFADATVALPYGEEDLTAIFHLLSRSWFERLWVRQEASLANSQAVVQCGTASILWSTFRAAWLCLFSKMKSTFRYTDELHHRLQSLRGFLLYWEDIQLRHLRTFHGDSKCSDPRDRVYGVLNMIDSRYHRLGIVPDYTKSKDEVYEDLAIRYLQHFADLNIVTSCILRPKRSLPSWVPDWSPDDDLKLNPCLPANARAGGPFSARWSITQPGHLQLSGVYVGTIDYIQRFNLPIEWNTHGVASTLVSVFRDVNLKTPYIGGGTLLDAYVHALSLGNFADNYHPPIKGTNDSDTQKAMFGYLMDPRIWATPDLSDSRLQEMLSEFGNNLNGNCLFETEEGYVGMGPEVIMEGDEVCVAIGCDAALVRRGGGEAAVYELVSTCSVYGVDHGEILLGSLPQGFHQVTEYNTKTGGLIQGIVDRSSATLLYDFDDPRLEGLDFDRDAYLKKLAADHHARVNMDVEQLRSRGVDVTEFCFV